jgi:serine/threonine-protein kinase
MADPATDRLAQVRVGTTLNGKWHLDAVLGAGGMAIVYKATHRNGHRVAVKILHPLLSAQDAPRERFLREGYIANKVEHRDAVSVLDEDVDEAGNVFLVMELLEGEPVSVRRRAAGGRLAAAEALWIASRLLHVLEAAHAHGIVHRDIKPENLFLTSDGNLKVLDFGIARFGLTHGGHTLHGIPMGTPGFAAPEQVRGEWDDVDGRADLFAVGATMFTLVVGKLVHEQSSPYAHLQRMALEPPPHVRDVDASIPVDLAKVIDRALSFRPENRFQTATDMRHAVASAFLSLTGRPLPERLPEQPIGSHRVAQSEAVPTVLSPAWPRHFSGAPSASSKVRYVVVAGLAMGILGLGLIFKLQRPTRPSNADSVQTVLRTDVPLGAGSSAPIEVTAAEGTVEALEPVATESTTAMPSPSPVTSSSERAPAAVGPASSTNRLRPAPPTDRSAEPSLARPATSPSPEVRIPTASDRSAGPSAPRGGGRMDFVEKRH